MGAVRERSCVRNTCRTCNLESSLPRGVKSLKMEPGYEVGDKFGNIMLRVDVDPSLQLGK